ncbi:hypothetical protein AcW1_003693 [Taiwanofungus camphoratus]|nr:hypothetical protein AcW1_003693 [Antrodia cinnamomea]
MSVSKGSVLLPGHSPSNEAADDLETEPESQPLDPAIVQLIADAQCVDNGYVGQPIQILVHLDNKWPKSKSLLQNQQAHNLTTDVITPLLKKLRHTYRSPATSSQLNVEDELNTTALDKKNKRIFLA